MLDPSGDADQHSVPVDVAPEGWQFAVRADADPQLMAKFKAEIAARANCFAFSAKDMPGYKGDLAPVHWELDTDRPIWCHPNSRRYTAAELEILHEKFSELKEAGLIEQCPTTNPYSCMPLVAAKKDAKTGLWTDKRVCINYIPINKHMIPDKYVPPLPEDIFQQIKGCPWTSSFDLRQGFLQLPLSEAAARTTAFWWPRKDGSPMLWRYKFMPFGGRNSVALFQAVVDYELSQAGLTHCARAYVDDVIIFSKTLAEHIQHTIAVLEHLRKVGLMPHPAKTQFAMPSIEFVGHQVGPYGLTPVEAKAQAMAKLPTPGNVSDVRTVMGVLGYYRCYIPNFSIIAAPINRLTSASEPWNWTPECDAAFKALKTALITEGVGLRFPDDDRTFIVHSDWCEFGLGAVLGQRDDEGREFLVACASRSCNDAERRYEPWRGEMLACVFAVKSFRYWLHGRKFELVTDHRPLLWLMTAKEPTGQQIRWLMQLQEYDFSIRHRPGRLHANADAVSRFPLKSQADFTGARIDARTPEIRLPDVIMPDGRVLQGEALASTFGEPVPKQKAVKSAAAAVLATGSGASDWLAATFAAMACEVGMELLPPFTSPVTPVASLTAASSAQAALRAVDSVGFIDAQQQALLVTCAAASVQRYDSRQDWVDACGKTPSPAALVNITGSAFDPVGIQPSEIPSWYAEQQAVLRQQVSAWVQYSRPPAPQPDDLVANGTVDVRCVAPTFFAAAEQHGLVVFEPFGGLCSGLEATLRMGFRVGCYIYADTSRVSRQVAQHRLLQLSQRYPEQLSPAAWQGAFSALPQDVRAITFQHVQKVVAAFPSQQWLLVAGWECQDLSPAGSSSGLAGPKSSTYFDLLQITQWLQLALGSELPLGYVFENTAFQHNWRSAKVRGDDFLRVCQDLGAPVVVDAAQLGSRASRVRNFWTNLCPIHLLSTSLELISRPQQHVQQLLPPGRHPQPVDRQDAPPKYPANQPGSLRAAWPTLMAYPGSWAFQPGCPGSVWDEQVGSFTEPTAEEREQAMGYMLGDTAAPGVTAQQRCAVLGRAIDANSLQYLFGIAWAWYRRGIVQGAVPAHTLPAPPQNRFASEPGIAAAVASASVHTAAEQLAFSLQICAAAAQTEGNASSTDIWDDPVTLHMLQHGTFHADTSAVARNRAQKRLQYYGMFDGVLRRRMADGSTRVVPKPEEREELIQAAHTQTGHFGVQRTAALLSHSYWWRSMFTDVKAVVSRCSLCDRARSSFSAVQRELRPLPIIGIMYRWGCDLAGPFPETEPIDPKRPISYTYAMVAVEHFSKFLVLEPIPAKEPVYTARVFERILATFGGCAECLTDRGSEWGGEFRLLLARSLIDARYTSPLHPEANGLAERCVQVIKRGLSKMVEQEGQVHTWDRHLSSLQLAYNCSPQQSTKFAPFTLMFGCTPSVPPVIERHCELPLMLEDDPDTVAELLLKRQQQMEANLVAARSNLEIAQHRDTLRYAKLRDGAYLPSVTKFQAGQYVYVKTAEERAKGLQLNVRPIILRVKRVNDDGSLLLEGSNGNTTTRNAMNCSPCHLPNVDAEQDLSQLTVDGDLPCSICGSPDDEAVMLVCEGCALGWHIYCLNPPLAAVPDGVWVCHVCQDSGVTPEVVLARQQRAQGIEQQQQQHADQRRRLFPSATQRRRNERYVQLHGRLIYQQRPVDDEPDPVVGRLLFTGSEFTVRYADGSSEVLSNSAVAKRQHWLLPEGTAVPPSLQHPDFDAPSWAAITAATADLSITAEEQHTGFPKLGDQPGSCAYERTLQADVMALLRQLNLRSSRTVFELNPTSATAERVFAAFGYDLSPAGDLSNPLFTADAIICTSPSGGSLELVTSVLPLLVNSVAVIRVPLSWMSQADPVWGGISHRDVSGSLLEASDVGQERWVWLAVSPTQAALHSVLQR